MNDLTSIDITTPAPLVACANSHAESFGCHNPRENMVLDELHCPVCTFRFSFQGSLTPKISPCLHTACEGCFQKSQRSCPVCQEDLMAVEEMQVNRFTLQALQMFEVAQSCVFAHGCGMCDHRTAQYKVIPIETFWFLFSAPLTTTHAVHGLSGRR